MEVYQRPPRRSDLLTKHRNVPVPPGLQSVSQLFRLDKLVAQLSAVMKRLILELYQMQT